MVDWINLVRGRRSRLRTFSLRYLAPFRFTVPIIEYSEGHWYPWNRGRSLVLNGLSNYRTARSF
jgi:hypothetical protein